MSSSSSSDNDGKGGEAEVGSVASATSVSSASSTSMSEDAEEDVKTGDSESSKAAAAAAADGRSLEELEAESLRLKTLGNEALAANNMTAAIGHYTEALECTPRSAVVRSNRALAYVKVENYGLAIADADVAIEADASYAKAYYRRGTANFALTKYAAARRDFRAVCKLRSKDKDARARLEECEKALRAKSFAEAIASEETVPLSDTYDPASLVVGDDYDGPHPAGTPLDDAEEEEKLFQPGNLPLPFVMAAVERFREQKLIHKRYLARLLISAKRYFESLSSLMELSLPEKAPSHSESSSPRMTVCGDTHGQYYDLLHIFQQNGYPSVDNPYLFNGDFVDRGSFSVEVILTLLLFKLHHVDCLFLTRGNHETKTMNRIYGFEGEVKAKYGGDGKMFDLFLEVFSYLPLAAVIEKKIFVTHGGIPVTPGISLDDIDKIKRGMEPPESSIMSDLMWADPQPQPGKSPSKRGVGFSFGPDITEAFLAYNQLDLLIRSHEVKEEGYQVEHDGKTITIFSAPNYCDSSGNKGAYIHLDASLEPKFIQFDAVPHPDVKPMAYAAGMGGLFA